MILLKNIFSKSKCTYNGTKVRTVVFAGQSGLGVRDGRAAKI